MSDTPNTLWVKGYTADGFQVSITVGLDPANLAQWITDALEAVRAAGIHPREQGTEPGEDTHTLAYVVRRSKVNDDGSETPVIDLYNDKFDFRVAGIYLNTPDDRRAFEQATGLTVDSIRLFDGNAPLSRQDPKFSQRAVAVPAVPGFTVRKNPRWDDSKTPVENKVPKHLFARWMTDAGAPSAAPAPAPTQKSRTDQLVDEIDATRSPKLGPPPTDDLAGRLTDNQFVATTIQKKAKDGKEWYVLLSEDRKTFATTWGLSEYEVFDEDERVAFSDYDEHDIGKVLVTWTAKGKFKNVTGMLRLEDPVDHFQDIPF